MAESIIIEIMIAKAYFCLSIVSIKIKKQVEKICQQQQHFISPHNIQEIKIYNNSTDDDRGAGCPK